MYFLLSILGPTVSQNSTYHSFTSSLDSTVSDFTDHFSLPLSHLNTPAPQREITAYKSTVEVWFCNITLHFPPVDGGSRWMVTRVCQMLNCTWNFCNYCPYYFSQDVIHVLNSFSPLGAISYKSPSMSDEATDHKKLASISIENKTEYRKWQDTEAKCNPRSRAHPGQAHKSLRQMKLEVKHGNFWNHTNRSKKKKKQAEKATEKLISQV